MRFKRATGWLLPIGRRQKNHWVRNGRSLCGRVRAKMGRDRKLRWDDISADSSHYDCVNCLRMRKRERKLAETL